METTTLVYSVVGSKWTRTSFPESPRNTETLPSGFSLRRPEPLFPPAVYAPNNVFSSILMAGSRSYSPSQKVSPRNTVVNRYLPAYRGLPQGWPGRLCMPEPPEAHRRAFGGNLMYSLVHVVSCALGFGGFRWGA